MWLQFGWGSLGTARRRGLPVGVASQGPSLPRRFHHTIGRLVGGGGLSAGGAAGTLGLAPGFVFTCVCHGAAHSVATGSQESIPRQAVGAARPLRTWLGNRLGIAPALFPGQSACGDHLHPRGGGPDPSSAREEGRTICGIFKPPHLFPFLSSTSSSSSYFSSTVTRMYGMMCLDPALCSVFPQRAKDMGPSRLPARSPVSSMPCRQSESVALSARLILKIAKCRLLHVQDAGRKTRVIWGQDLSLQAAAAMQDRMSSVSSVSGDREAGRGCCGGKEGFVGAPCLKAPLTRPEIEDSGEQVPGGREVRV